VGAIDVSDRVWGQSPDLSLRGGNKGDLNGRPLGQEYDGLESGELGWILGRRFMGELQALGAPGEQDDPRNITWAAQSQSAHALGMGHGVDRMQRLAAQPWMEAYFRSVFGSKVVPLENISLSGQRQIYSSSDLNKYQPYVAGASVLGSVDLPHVVNGLYSNAAVQLQYYNTVNPATGVTTKENAVDLRGGGAGDGLATGLFTLEAGPFLRGKVIDDSPVEMICAELATVNRGMDIFHTMPRNMGDDLAFDALYSELRAMSFFDWTPDGMVLSKLESPSGDPMSSAELDARQAQLFNVCIQGPALAKTWTGEAAMHVMPLDRVFVVMVADVHTKVGAEKTGIGAGAALRTHQDDYAAWVRPGGGAVRRGGVKPDIGPANTEFATGKTAAGANGTFGSEYVAKLQELYKQVSIAGGGGLATQVNDAKAAAQTARDDMDAFFGPIEMDASKPEAFVNVAEKVRRGKLGAKSATMTNFRLMRVTSSFLSNTSCAKFDASGNLDRTSRCGLNLGCVDSTAAPNAQEYIASYIIGGWCIGTVIDSAASRSTVGHLVRIAPASMAININVNIEWWSGDDLYRRYMDVQGTTLQRGVMPSPAGVTLRRAMADVSLADLPEPTPTVPAGKPAGGPGWVPYAV